MRRRSAAERAAARNKSKEILFFGEDTNDRLALTHLVRALRPDAPILRQVSQPLVLIRNRTEAVKRDTLARIKQVVIARSCRAEVIAVVAHEDCDECEPAHEPHAREIEGALNADGVPQPIAPSPAFEMETWWFLWPDAVGAVRGCWSDLPRKNRNVGVINNAKEALTRALRSFPKCPDYHVSDSPKIARKVLELGIIREPVARSASFERFRDRVDALTM